LLHRLAPRHSTRPIFARFLATAVATALAVVTQGAVPSLAGAMGAVSPTAGTPDASQDTQISILGPPAARIRSVRVTGSTSGRHAGHLASYGARPGASFVLGTPLAHGETVSVEVSIRGRRPARTWFTVARRPPAVAPFLPLASQQPDKLDHFVSRPDLLPPKIAVFKPAPDLGGDIFLMPLPSPTVHTGGGGPLLTLNPVGPGGPMIVDGRGSLVWFKQLPPNVEAANLRTATYDGKRVLTWWEGRITGWAYGSAKA
jgi:hypothetical protein